MRKPGRMVGRWALLAGASGLLAACSSSGVRERYVVEVMGSRAALEQYTVQADGLRDEGLSFSRNQYLRQLTAQAEEGLLDGPALSLQSRRDGQVVDEVPLQPFVCRTSPEKHARLRESGWRFVERHQLLLAEDGKLKRNTDLDRTLLYACEARPPDAGDSGEGWSTPLSTPGACTEPERAATQVVLESGGTRRTAELCHATYLQLHGGAVHLGFSFREPGRELPLTVSLWHCMEPPTASYPLTLVVGEDYPRADCPRVPGASGLVGSELVFAPLLRGRWRIERIDFVEGGHLVGEVDAVFEVPGGSGEMRLHGPVDLPMLRIPLSGGNRP